MSTMGQFLYEAFSRLVLICKKKTDEIEPQYIAFGIFGIINYPLSYFMWHDVIPQLYNPFSLRLIAGLLCVPLVLKNYWPPKIRPYLPLYWYTTLLYCLPFFATFMLLKNHLSNAWLMNLVLGLLLFILLVDWLSFFMLLFIGGFVGWLCYALTDNTLSYSLNGNSISLAMYMYLFVVIIVGVFSRNKENVAKEKLQAVKAMGASIAHELRTPLRTISSMANGIKEYLPSLIKSYQLAKQEKLPVPMIPSLHYEALLTACDDIESETHEAFTIINMLLMNVSQNINPEDFQKCSINHCIDETLRRYPFDEGDKIFVQWQLKNDFSFEGNELLIIHVLFNLLKNALYQIKATGKGEIEIKTVHEKKYNTLYFIDTAKGISSKMISHIFDKFYSQTYHGTGIGLAFCKIVMENLGGKIVCHSEEGKYAEFILYFPKVSQKNDV